MVQDHIALISATTPDWTREYCPSFHWNPGKALLRTLRDYERSLASQNPLRFLRRKIIVLRHRFWSAIAGAEIPLGCKIGGGLLIPHPNGIVIHPSAVIGPNCLILQQVTLAAGRDGAPRLGGHVDVGAGAKLLGALSVGDHAQVGANAVVLDDVPNGATAVGVPARILAASPRAEPMDV